MLRTRQHATALLAITILVTIAYWPVFSAGFVYDDHIFVENVQAYRDFDVEKIFLGLANGVEYLPVRDLSITLDAAIWGDQPFGYHLSSLLLFLGLLAAMYFLILKTATFANEDTAGQTAFLATLIFALHPLNTEAVSFIAARNNILALFFVFLSALGFLAFVRGKISGGVLCILAFALATLSKASVIFYPAALTAIYAGLAPRKSRSFPVWAVIAALWLVSIGGAALHANIAGQTGMTHPDLARYGAGNLAVSVARAALIPAFYLRYFILPWPQSISHDETALIAWASIGSATVLYSIYIAICFFAFYRRRQQPLIFAGLIWFFASLIPISNLISTSTFVAERYLFAGMPGLALIVACAVHSIRPAQLRLALLAAIAGALMIATNLRNRVWQTDVTLWEATWRVTPSTGAHPYINALMDNGQIEKALEISAAEIPRTYRYALVRCESFLSDLRYSEALPFCNEALNLSAGYSATVRLQIRLALARAHEGAGDDFAALHHYLQAAKEDSATSRLFFQDGAESAIARLRRRLEPLERELGEDARNRPYDVTAQGEYGLFLLRCGHYQEAVYYLERAHELRPGDWQISYNQGLAAIQSGDVSTAQIAFTRLPPEVPAYAEGLNQLARHYSRRGDEGTALEYWRLAVEAQPGNRTYRYNLARVYMRSGSRESARDVLQAGLTRADESDRAFYRQAMNNLGL